MTSPVDPASEYAFHGGKIIQSTPVNVLLTKRQGSVLDPLQTNAQGSFSTSEAAYLLPSQIPPGDFSSFLGSVGTDYELPLSFPPSQHIPNDPENSPPEQNTTNRLTLSCTHAPLPVMSEHPPVSTPADGARVVDIVPKRQRKRKAFEQSVRAKVKRVRTQGACVRCRVYKETVCWSIPFKSLDSNDSLV